MHSLEHRNLVGIHQTLLQRIYPWIRDTAIEEVELDFPIARSMHTMSSCTILRSFEALRPETRINAMLGRIKKIHHWGSKLCKDSITEQEQHALTNFDTVFHKSLAAMNRYPARSHANKMSKPYPRRQFVSSLLQPRLADRIGMKKEKTSPDGARISIIQIHDWSVQADFDIGGNMYLQYDHTIRSSNRSRLIAGQSLPALLGYPAMWDSNDVTDSNAEQVADLLVDWCSQYIKAAESWLDGLSSERFEQELIKAGPTDPTNAYIT